MIPIVSGPGKISENSKGKNIYPCYAKNWNFEKIKTFSAQKVSNHVFGKPYLNNCFFLLPF